MTWLTICNYRFGNFIGEEVGSEEASEAGVDTRDYAYDDDEPDQRASVTGQELMEIDGKLWLQDQSIAWRLT